MYELRKSEDRGSADHGWLRSKHSFSFGGYHDPRFMGFGPLRVINEDRVVGGAGFPTHPHRDMEILSYVLEGALQHEDSMGNGSIIRPGELQRMSAGTGVQHSEYNADREAPVHFLQIWILPERTGLQPSYEQSAFPAESRHNQLRLLASPDAEQGSVRLHQDVRLYGALLDADARVEHRLAPGRRAWVQVARGELDVNGQALGPGDGLAAAAIERLELSARRDAELLLFELP